MLRLFEDFRNVIASTEILRAALFSRKGGLTLSVHVRIRQPSHERVWTDGFLGADPSRKLCISVAKLVDVDCYHICVVVELDETLNRFFFT